jgi:UDP-N-acetyl-D-mannosaminuronic acid dehydrogenase
MSITSQKHISIIGGAGHIGLPLGLAFTNKGFYVHLIDKNIKNMQIIKNSKMPFLEFGSKKILNNSIKRKQFFFENDLKNLKQSKFIFICIGTPIDSKLKPNLKGFKKLIDDLKKYVQKNQIIIVRSSVYPGTILDIKKRLKNVNKNIFYCPERIVQSKSLIELPRLPQIIAPENNVNFKIVKKLFKKITSKIIKTSILEAELIKLYSNANRYINFAIANQLYTICQSHNLDFDRVRKIMQDGYARNLNLAKAGFTSGPCLLKDTMQLKSFCNNDFQLGSAAMEINENIPNLIIEKIKSFKNSKKKKIGLLGLTFKGETDDIRDSLSIKLLNKLKKLKFKTYQSDEYYLNKNNITKEQLIAKSDIIIIGAPHKIYKKINYPKNKNIINIWG